MNEVSLYIPCFNAARTIGACLEGVFKQSYPIKEVLIIDDGSNDETSSIASRYPVRIIRHENNRGLAAARNTAIRNMNTEFAASLDADCLPESEWLEHLMKRFGLSKIAGVGGRLLEADSKSIFDAWRSAHMQQHWEAKKDEPPFLFGSNTVLRREIIEKVGFYDEGFTSNYEDVDISDRIKKAEHSLVYEPKAVVRHLKNDDIRSILNSYWKWHLGYYRKEGYYSNQDRFIFKIKDNLGLANRYIEEDIAGGKEEFIYLDFLLAIHHSLRDFEYFISQGNERKHNPHPSSLSVGLGLIELAIFYHPRNENHNLNTLLPEEDAFLQNFLALELLLGHFILDNFKNNNFRNRMYKHLFLSVYGWDNDYLLNKLCGLIESHYDWRGLLKKTHSNLNIVFLENLSSAFQEWFIRFKFSHHNIIRLIENSCELTDKITVL